MRGIGMIQRLVFIAVLITALALAGCGGGGNAGGDAAPVGISLAIGVPVTVFPGDQLEPSSSNTRINVVHNINNNTKQVTLLEGSANLLRGDFVVNN
jgi:hypothetical protein